MKMKNASNIAAAAGIGVVLVSFILKTIKIIEIDMNDAIKVGAFLKCVFLPVDASVWINNILGKKD